MRIGLSVDQAALPSTLWRDALPAVRWRRLRTSSFARSFLSRKRTMGIRFIIILKNKLFFFPRKEKSSCIQNSWPSRRTTRRMRSQPRRNMELPLLLHLLCTMGSRWIEFKLVKLILFFQGEADVSFLPGEGPLAVVEETIVGKFISYLIYYYFYRRSFILPSRQHHQLRSWNLQNHQRHQCRKKLAMTTINHQWFGMTRSLSMWLRLQWFNWKFK